MGRKLAKKRRAVLRLRYLDHSKSSILNSLGSEGSRRAYEFALDEFIAWLLGATSSVQPDCGDALPIEP